MWPLRNLLDATTTTARIITHMYHYGKKDFTLGVKNEK